MMSRPFRAGDKTTYVRIIARTLTALSRLGN
jgi:hypothetical protein